MELSEKLKAKLTETKNEPNTLKWMDLLQQIGALVIDHQDAIIAALDSSEHKAKCVQFAEDVERLIETFGEFRVGKHRKQELEVEYQSSMRRTTHADIFTAARKAAEALKGEA